MLTLQGVAYTDPNKDVLFSNISLTVNRHSKIAVTGNNGTGKSTLLKIIAGRLQPSAGTVKAGTIPYYIPQIVGQFNNYTVAQALGINGKLTALTEVINGNVTETNLAIIGDDWMVEERCREAFAHWQLSSIQLNQKMDALSGGQKTKVFLAGILINQRELVLLDEPSNHLDAGSRNMLYDYIQTTNHTLVVVSHDRALLNLLSPIYELDKDGITAYGGNYDFYAEQKRVESAALNEDLRSKEKELRKAKEAERETMERQQKLDARGKKKQEKAGLPTILMNTFRNSAEKSTARVKDVHAVKIDAITKDLSELRAVLPGIDKMKMGFDDSGLHKGKVLVSAKGINISYDDTPLWNEGLSFDITSGERIAIKGRNGSGKTTLIKLVLGELKPQAGTLTRADTPAIYIDQDYCLIDNTLNVYQQAQQFNTGALQEHEVKIRLTRFLFTKSSWHKPCSALSGGEKMRLMLCCLTITAQAPGIIVLDEPANNLDMQNVEILTAAINNYDGTLLIVSHDQFFLEQARVSRIIDLGADSTLK